MEVNVAKTIFKFIEAQIKFNTIWVYMFLIPFLCVFVSILKLKYAKNILFSLDHIHQTMLMPCPNRQNNAIFCHNLFYIAAVFVFFKAYMKITPSKIAYVVF